MEQEYQQLLDLMVYLVVHLDIMLVVAVEQVKVELLDQLQQVFQVEKAVEYKHNTVKVVQVDLVAEKQLLVDK